MTTICLVPTWHHTYTWLLKYHWLHSLCCILHPHEHFYSWQFVLYNKCLKTLSHLILTRNPEWVSSPSYRRELRPREGTHTVLDLGRKRLSFKYSLLLVTLACHWILWASVFSTIKWEENATSSVFVRIKALWVGKGYASSHYYRTILVKASPREITILAGNMELGKCLSHSWLSQTIHGFGNTNQVSGLNGRNPQALQHRYPACYQWAKPLVTGSLPVLLKCAEKTENVYAVSSTYSQLWLGRVDEATPYTTMALETCTVQSD